MHCTNVSGEGGWVHKVDDELKKIKAQKTEETNVVLQPAGLRQSFLIFNAIV